MSQRLRIVVSGLIAQHPLGGVTWFYLQYALGLARLGHDVFYIEDTGEWPYRLDGSFGPTAMAPDCSFNVKYLSDVMARFGLDGKWAYYCQLEKRWFGLTDAQRTAVVQSADLLVNVSGTIERPEEYLCIPRRAYIDTDPVFTHVRLARGDKDICHWTRHHNVHFSYAESPTACVPPTGYRWRPTRAPIVMSEWNAAAPRRDVFTTIMNWTSYESELFEGRTYGQKDVEFRRFLDLPRMVAPAVLELAIGAGHSERTPYELLSTKGWKLVDPVRVCPDLDSFRTYTQSSMAEWGVAKNGYVVGKSGWFSERTARYLAAGRPVVVQDTGFGGILPTGEGILPFLSIEEAADGIRQVQSDYQRHARAARAIADEYFDSDKVLERLVNEAMESID